MGTLARVLRSASRRAIGVASRARIAPAAHPISIKEPREFPEATTRPTSRDHQRLIGGVLRLRLLSRRFSPIG